MFRQARGLFFNSEGELNVAAALYGPWVHARSAVIGHAVDVGEFKSDAPPIKGFVPQRSRYLLFLGRADKTKNIDLALEAFARFRDERRTTSLQLIVAGPHARPVTDVDGVVDLGAVTEEGKAALLSHARAIIQPSTNESFSRTVYEAWHLRRPVVVHADCVATAELVEASGGGWTARSIDDWAQAFASIDESSDSEIDGIGMRGRAVSLRSGSWDDVATRALAAITARLADPADRLNQIVSLERRSVGRAAQPRFDDAINIVSIAPIRTVEDSSRLLEIFALVRSRVDNARLLIMDEACSPDARSDLDLSASSFGIREHLVFLHGDDVDGRYAAWRDAHLACAFGAALEDREVLNQAMWFDVPVVAFGDDPASDVVEATGVICDRTDRMAAAALLCLVATDGKLGASIVAEQRVQRSRSKNAGQPESVSFRTESERREQ